MYYLQKIMSYMELSDSISSMKRLDTSERRRLLIQIKQTLKMGTLFYWQNLPSILAMKLGLWMGLI